ncbi:TIGR02647 family protein [Agitococcus lubricus]|nr:TIGR02647 family protein [Agitococcus lubricus]
MQYSIDLIEELTVLSMFDLGNHQAGLKIHHTAEPVIIAAAQRLYQKGLTSHVDGGYLTQLGIEAAEHAQAALTILDT